MRPACAPGGSPIRIGARPSASRRVPFVEISVADEGPGIAAEERERVFEMFSQNGGGARSGLGLAIAKAFVEAHGGAIWIDPDDDAGARVVFTVPAATNGCQHVVNGSGPMTKVLVVDDDLALVKALASG